MKPTARLYHRIRVISFVLNTAELKTTRTCTGRNFSMRLISFAAIAVLVGAAPALIRADEGQWKPLFDGKSLAGWKQRGGMAKYRASGEEIVGVSVPNT